MRGILAPVFSFSCICFLFCFFSFSFPLQQPPRDWSAEYNKLARRVLEKEGQPRGGPKQLRPYLNSLEKKAKDRDDVKKLYLEVLDLSNIDRESQAIADWITKFQKLLDRAQESGNYTARLGATMLLRIDYRFGGDNWERALFKLQNEGRPLYNKASETEFANDYIRDYARCLANYAVKDVEIGKMGLYKGRERLGGVLDPEGILVPPTRDHVADCERRTEFQTIEKGEPAAPLDEGLKMVERIRDECEWWQFGKERADATELMVEFYKDVLCKDPPKKGHKWCLDQAKKYSLNDAIDHNEGFYAKIFGKVEILTDEGKKPAPGAKVRVYSPLDDQEWTTTADEDGEYEIEDVILHKECSPFEISAEYGGDKEETEFNGPLEEPDRSYEFDKDLLIEPKGWEGTIKYHWVSHMPKDSPVRSEFDTVEAEASKNWTLEVEMEIDSVTEKEWTYKLKSATLDFEEKFKFQGSKKDEEMSTQIGQEIVTNLKRRELRPEECELTLVIDLGKKVYRMEGLFDVEDIAQEGSTFVNVRDKSGFTYSNSEPIDDTTDIVDRADFGGHFADTAAVEIKGCQEEEVPPLAGPAVMGLSFWFDNITGEIEWEFKKGKGE